MISNYYSPLGVRCTESDFVPDLRDFYSTHGIKHGWTAYLTELSIRQCGSDGLPWNETKVLLIQAFWGPREAGHFAVLVLDRTREGNPLAVYADSLPNYQPDAMDSLKGMLLNTRIRDTGIVVDGMTWIKASIPTQGTGTNDCGVIASCFSLMYVRGLENDGLLSDLQKSPPIGFQEGPAQPIRAVDLVLPPGLSMCSFGALGRAYMWKALRDAELDFGSDFFKTKVQWTF